jgi:hypothetical protein
MLCCDSLSLPGAVDGWPVVAYYSRFSSSISFRIRTPVNSDIWKGFFIKQIDGNWEVIHLMIIASSH